MYSMLNNDIIGLLIHLMRVYLLVNRPRQRLPHQVLKLSDPRHIRILRIISIYDRYEVLFGESLDIIQKFFDQIIVVLAFLASHRDVREQA